MVGIRERIRAASRGFREAAEATREVVLSEGWAEDPSHPMGRALEPPQFFAGPRRTGGIMDTSGASSQALLENAIGWPAIANSAIADRILDLELEVGTTERGTRTFRPIEHPLEDAFDANPQFGAPELQSLAAFHLGVVGRAYWFVVEDGLGVPREFWPLLPHQVEPEFESTGQVREYVFSSEAGEDRFGPEEIVEFRRPAPSNPFRGGGPLEPQAIAADALRFLDETVATLYANDAVPRVLFETANTGGGDQLPKLPQGRPFTRWLRLWRLFFRRRGGKFTGLPGFAPPGWVSKVLPAMGGLQGNETFATHYRDRMLMAYRVPRSVLGDVVDANRAAAETNRYVFDLNAVTPVTSLIARTLTRYGRRTFDRRELAVRFVPFLQDDPELELRREDQDLKHKVRRINDVLEDRGSELRQDHGDEAIGTFADVPYRPDEAAEALGLEDDEPDEDLEEDDLEEDDDERGGRSDSRWAPDVVYARVGRFERRYIGEVTRAMRRAFARQRDEALVELRSERGRAFDRAPVFERNVDDLLELIGDDAFRRAIVVEVFPILRRAFRTVMRSVLHNLEAGIAPATFDEAVVGLLERQGADLVTNVNSTTRKRLRAELQRGIVNGEGIDAIASRVNKVFRGRRANARTIAQTETVTAVQGAHLQAFDSVPDLVPRKRWNTSRDEAVRDFELGDSTSHRIDGQVRDRDQPFTLGDGEGAMAPGVGVSGGALSARNRINCRCFVTPVFEGEED